MGIGLYEAFDMIGAELVVESAGDVFEIDVRNEAGREVFRLRYPSSDVVATEALEVKPKLRHLVLDVSGWRLPISGRYLCGHDERHWFLASLPVNRHTTTVRGAMEALKPDVVKRAQKRLRVRHRRYRRKTAAYIRQGEWFFLPRPMMQVDDRALPNGQLVREGGKPHQAEWIYRPEGLDATFVRGSVSHPDHETIRLEVWHRVVQNTEVRIVQDKEGRTRSRDQPSTRMAYLD